MRSLRLPLLAGAVLLAVGCTRDAPVAPESPNLQSAAPNSPGAGPVVVMNQNLYVGTDVDAVIRALASPDPNDDIPVLLAQLAVLQETDFPSRAGALADEIARIRPHIVGLQEVSKVDIDLTPFGLPAVYHVDFLPVLLEALRNRGLSYDVGAQVQNIVAAPIPGISLIDYDAMLVDSRRVALGPGTVERNYSTNIGPVAPGVTLIRGWVSVLATIEGRRYRVASTHLESGNAPGLDLLRAAQMQELIASIAMRRGPSSWVT